MLYPVAKRVMMFIANAQTGAFEDLGVSHADFRRVTGAVPWLPAERNRVRQVIDTLLFASIDMMGMTRFQVPAEYIAALLGMVIHPVNMMPACRIMEGVPSVERSASGVADDVTAEELFDLAIQLHTTESAVSAREQFEKQVGIKIAHAESQQAEKKGK